MHNNIQKVKTAADTGNVWAIQYLEKNKQDLKLLEQYVASLFERLEQHVAMHVNELQFLEIEKRMGEFMREREQCTTKKGNLEKDILGMIL